jgi:hypothetical protein
MLPAILNNLVGLRGNILHVSRSHGEINMAEKPLNCEWIS